MIREVVLETSGQKDWTSVVSGREVNIRVVSCRPQGKRGMLQLVMINSKEPVKEVLRAIRAHPNVDVAKLVKTNDHRASGLVTTRNSPFCRTVAEFGGFCLSCFYSDETNGHQSWNLVFEGGVSMNKLLRNLKKRGIAGAVKEVDHLRGNSLLTFTQEEALKLAENRGYYAVPRMVGVRELAEIMRIAPSTLDEVLRRAEGKVISSYTKTPK